MRIDWENISIKDLAGYISKILRQEGIELILVGGACVTIYSKNRYQSHDLDFVTYEDLRKVKKVLKNTGFTARNRYFCRENCPWIIEFVAPPVAVGNQPVKEYSQLRTRYGTVKMLRPEDSIKDRLASYYHWDDEQSLNQAISICMEFSKINFRELQKWSANENSLVKYKKFLSELKKTNLTK